MGIYKCLSYPQLKKAAKQSITNDYNRQIDPKKITEELCGLEKPDTVLFPIDMYMIHRHREGKSCKAHIRAFVVTPNVKLCIDFNKELFDTLQTINMDGLRGSIELPEDQPTFTVVNSDPLSKEDTIGEATRNYVDQD
jgi:hypothetical protein